MHETIPDAAGYRVPVSEWSEVCILLQVPVAELLARPVPTLHSPSVQNKKSSNFLQVPEIEAPRPKSVPNSPSIPRYRNKVKRQWVAFDVIIYRLGSSRLSSLVLI